MRDSQSENENAYDHRDRNGNANQPDQKLPNHERAVIVQDNASSLSLPPCFQHRNLLSQPACCRFNWEYAFSFRCERVCYDVLDDGERPEGIAVSVTETGSLAGNVSSRPSSSASPVPSRADFSCRTD